MGQVKPKKYFNKKKKVFLEIGIIFDKQIGDYNAVLGGFW